jgi:2'-5' RNA ligase
VSTQRLFFALWPDEPVRARLRTAARELVPPEARAIAPDAAHLTLLFIGSADAVRRACLEQVADGIKGSSFTLTLDQAGFWRKPQILWLGCSTLPAPLLALVQGLTAGAERCGVKTETQPYQAHVTLARKVRKGPMSAVLIEPIVWPVERFCLVESHTEPEGVRYRTLRFWSLNES